jgi:hypothetical protein
MKTHLICLLSVFFSAAGAVAAQVAPPPETRNAALRYWLAFAELQDPPADQATQELLERTASGDAGWDETRLGPILDKNRYAIQRMQRATLLPECDWGAEYNWRGSIAYAPRARVLARLNTLQGLRLEARGDKTGAVNAWLHGIRFSQHLAEGGSLIFTVMAQTALLPNLRALTRATESGWPSDADRQRIEAAVRALPETGFDWSGAMRIEEAVLYGALDEMVQSSNSREFYATMMGTQAPRDFSVPSAPDRAAYHRLMADVEEALRQEPIAAQARLLDLTRQMSSGEIHWFFQKTTPSLTRVNERRAEVASARDRLLQALAARRR